MPAVLAATKHADASVRVNATTALGRLPGTTAIAQRLLEIAGGDAIDETKAALAALARLQGPGIDEMLLSGARAGAAPARVLCLRALTARYTLAALPLAHQLRQQESEATVRSAALDLLADLAPYSDQAVLIAYTFGLTNEQDVARAQRALIAITQRAPQPDAGIRALLAALEKAEPAVQARQLRMLSRLGDKDSLACAQRLAASPDAKVAAAAKATIERWPKPEEKKKK